MTHDILQSDIEFATRLTEDHRPEDEIIRALVHRGIDPGKAAQLVDALRGGKRITAESPAPPEFSQRRRRSRTGHIPTQTQEESSARSAPATPSGKAHAKPPGRGRSNTKGFWPIFAVLVCLALLVLGLVLFLRHQATTIPRGPRDAEPTTPQKAQPLPRTPAKAAAARPNSSAPQLVLELQPDGLHIGGARVTRDNLLRTVARLLGPAARTNRVAQTGAVVYAYDPQGLLIYTQPDGGTTGIVLDCEATGGTAGATSPFTGALKAEENVIGPDTDSQTLTAIKKLGLKRRGRTSDIWTGRYSNLELVFAYLRSPQRLSLIEIDLK